MRRHIVAADLLLAGGGDKIAHHQRTPGKVALERQRRALQAQVLLRGREDHALGRPRIDLAHFDMLARRHIGVSALQPVEADQFEALIFGIGLDHARSGGALADDLDHVAFGHAKLRHQVAADARNAVPTFFLPRACDLKAYRARLGPGFGCRICHEWKSP